MNFSHTISTTVYSCFVDNDNTELLCANVYTPTFAQYKSVNTSLFCKSHYCVITNDSPYDLVCSGLSFIKNKVTPIVPWKGHNGGDNLDRTAVDKYFDGYNIIAHEYLQNVVSTYSESMESLNCGATGYELCINGNVPCGGLYEFIIRDDAESVMLGVNLMLCIGLVLYLILKLCVPIIADSTMVNIGIIPAIALLSGVAIVNSNDKLVIKMHPAVLGAIIGVLISYLVATFLLYLTTHVSSTRRTTEINLRELDGDTTTTPRSTRFEIDDEFAKLNDDDTDDDTRSSFVGDQKGDKRGDNDNKDVEMQHLTGKVMSI